MKDKTQKIEKFERDMLFGKDIHITKKSGDTSYRLHWHSYYEIIYYKNCAGVCILNGKNFEVSKNCIFLLTPKDFHKIENDDNPNQESVNISFSESMAESRIIKEISANPMVLYDPPSELTDIINLIYGIIEQDEPLTDAKTRLLLNYILCEIISKGEKITSHNKYLNPHIGNAIAHMISDPGMKITLRDVARQSGMSEAYFSDLFHKETGTTFIKYLNRMKIEHAKRLIELDDISIVEICYECGFNNLSHFIRTFRQYENMSPSEYRKSKKDK